MFLTYFGTEVDARAVWQLSDPSPLLGKTKSIDLRKTKLVGLGRPGWSAPQAKGPAVIKTPRSKRRLKIDYRNGSTTQMAVMSPALVFHMNPLNPACSLRERENQAPVVSFEDFVAEEYHRHYVDDFSHLDICKEFFIITDARVFRFRCKTTAEASAWVSCLSVFKGYNFVPKISDRMGYSLLAVLNSISELGLKAFGFLDETDAVRDLCSSMLVKGTDSLKYEQDANRLTSLLKLLMMRMPQSLLTNSLFVKFLRAGDDVATLKFLVSQLPDMNFRVLKKLIEVCVLNGINVTDLCIAIGPYLLETHTGIQERATFKRYFGVLCLLLSTLMLHNEDIFSTSSFPLSRLKRRLSITSNSKLPGFMA